MDWTNLKKSFNNGKLSIPEVIWAIIFQQERNLQPGNLQPENTGNFIILKSISKKRRIKELLCCNKMSILKKACGIKITEKYLH